MRFRDLHPNIKLRILITFLSEACRMMLFPFMAIYLATHLGKSLTGALILINVLISIVTGFIGGYAADHIGRKHVMVIGQFFLAVSYIVMALANSPWLESVWLTYFMMLLSAICSGIIDPASEAMLVDESTDENRNYMYSVAYWSVNIAFSIGAFVGGLYFKDHAFALFLSGGVIAGLAFLITVIFIKDSFKPVIKAGHAEKIFDLMGMIDHYKVILKDSLYLIFTVATILVISLEFQLDKYIGVRLGSEFHQHIFGYDISGLKMLSFIIITNTVTIGLFTLVVSKLIGKPKSNRIFYIGLIVYTLGYGVLAFSNSFYLLFIAAFAFTVGEMIYMPIRQTVMADLIPEHSRSSYMAVNELSFQIAMLMGGVGLIIGSLISSYGMAILYVMMGFSALLLFRHVMVHARKQKTITVKQELTQN